MNRRTFLGTTALTAALAACSTGPAPRPEPFRISLAEWSLHRTLRRGEISNLDFPRTAQRTFGIDAVEFVNSFFKDRVQDAAYLAELKQRAADEGVRLLLIMIDGEGALGAEDAAVRAAAVARHTLWLEAARELGCHSIRVNAQSQGSRTEQEDRLVAGFTDLLQQADRTGVNVIIENHGGLSSDGAFLSGLMRRVNHPRFGSLPDFGNFTVSAGVEYDRYRGVAELMPFAKAVSAKSYDFGADGLETRIDYERMLRIVSAAGYHGHIGIEYEGDRLSEADGIRATKALLERLRAQMA